MGPGGRRHGMSALGFFVTATRWTTLSIEMAIELGCPCMSVDLVIMTKFICLRGSEFHPKGRVLGSRGACPKSFPSSKADKWLLCSLL